MQVAAGPKLPAKDSAAPRTPQPISKMDISTKNTAMTELENDLRIQQNYDSCNSGGNKTILFKKAKVISSSLQI